MLKTHSNVSQATTYLAQRGLEIGFLQPMQWLASKKLIRQPNHLSSEF
jgi:hypothetical protein